MNQCVHCKHKWKQQARVNRSPRCPKCQSRRWDDFSRPQFHFRRQDKTAKKRRCNRCKRNRLAKQFRIRADNGIPRAWCIPCENEYKREYKRANRYKWKKSEQRQGRRAGLRKYGLTETAYNEIAKDQDWKCLICSRRYFKSPRNLCVDHDHETGKIRGLLCIGCNRGLGYFEDQPERLRKAALYLERR
jgi:hypothetical protein